MTLFQAEASQCNERHWQRKCKVQFLKLHKSQDWIHNLSAVRLHPCLPSAYPLIRIKLWTGMTEGSCQTRFPKMRQNFNSYYYYCYYCYYFTFLVSVWDFNLGLKSIWTLDVTEQDAFKEHIDIISRSVETESKCIIWHSTQVSVCRMNVNIRWFWLRS